MPSGLERVTRQNRDAQPERQRSYTVEDNVASLCRLLDTLNSGRGPADRRTTVGVSYG